MTFVINFLLIDKKTCQTRTFRTQLNENLKSNKKLPQPGFFLLSRWQCHLYILTMYFNLDTPLVDIGNEHIADSSSGIQVYYENSRNHIRIMPIIRSNKSTYQQDFIATQGTFIF